MRNALNGSRAFLPAIMAVVALGGPMIIGALDGSRLQAQTPATASPGPAFEVASIKPNKAGDGRIGMMTQPGGRFTAIGGGVPVTNDDQLVAGVGVSGGTVEQDTAIVEAAMS